MTATSILGRINAVVGGQFGSEAKGHVAHRLIRQRAQEVGSAVGVVSTRVGGPNAGHTVIDDKGVAWPLRTVPVGAVTEGCQLVIAAGSEIEPDVLLAEIDGLINGGHHLGGRFYIDPEVTIITNGHKDAEHGDVYRGHRDLVSEIGSTGKGIGAARSARALRKAERLQDAPGLIRTLESYGVAVRDTADLQRDLLDAGATVVVEGTQGYGLGLHAGRYPFCTSTDCRAIDVLAQAGLNPWSHSVGGSVQTWVVVRPYPIRVAGNSGPLHEETTWEQLGLPAEITTVTKKTRRVGNWDPQLVREAVRANGGGRQAIHDGYYAAFGPVRVAFTMADQVIPGIAGRCALSDDLWEPGPDGHLAVGMAFDDWINKVERAAGERVALVTTGPNTAIWVAR